MELEEEIVKDNPRSPQSLYCWSVADTEQSEIKHSRKVLCSDIQTLQERYQNLLDIQKESECVDKY